MSKKFCEVNSSLTEKSTEILLKQKLLRSEIDPFKANLIILLDKIGLIEKLPKGEGEEHL